MGLPILLLQRGQRSSETFLWARESQSLLSLTLLSKILITAETKQSGTTSSRPDTRQRILKRKTLIPMRARLPAKTRSLKCSFKAPQSNCYRVDLQTSRQQEFQSHIKTLFWTIKLLLKSILTSETKTSLHDSFCQQELTTLCTKVCLSK